MINNVPHRFMFSLQELLVRIYIFYDEFLFRDFAIAVDVDLVKNLINYTVADVFF